MIDCAYCERPLICDGCQATYTPSSPELYRALSLVECPVLCPACGEVLVCHWCKTPYDGQAGDEDGGTPGDMA